MATGSGVGTPISESGVGTNLATMIDIRTDVQALLPSGYFSSVLTDAKLLALINTAQKWVCRGTWINPEGRRCTYNFDWLERECTQSTVDEQQRYALPAGDTDDAGGVCVWRYKEEISVELIDYQSYRRPLTRAFKEDIENDPTFADTADVGRPEAYAIDHSNIWLYPKPDHGRNNDTAWTINMEYFGYLPDLTVAAPSNYLTAECPEILKCKALSLAYQVGHDYDASEYWNAKAAELLIELVNQDSSAVHSGIETGMIPITHQAPGYCPSGSPHIETAGGYAG